MSSQLTVWIDGQAHPVSPGMAVGRDFGLGLRIDHHQVSRRHAEFRYDGARWSLHDLGSTNGLHLGNGRLNTVVLNPGRTELWLGPPESSPAIYVDVAAAQPAPPAAIPSPVATPGFGSVASPGPAPAVSNPSAGVPDLAGGAAPGPVPVTNEQLAGNVGFLTSVFEPRSESVLIGRAAECDLTIADPLVSRQHARLEVGSGGGRIVDLGSDNGTYVNGQRIAEAVLRDGDLVELGKAQFIMRGGQLQQYIAHGLPLRAEGLTVTVDNNLDLISDISFTLPAGTMTAVIGPSGSGKSTLLNALTGRRPADQGRVYLGGRDLYSSIEGIGRRIGFVPQDDPVHDTLTVRQALTAAARLRLPSDISKQEVASDVERVVAELGLTERLDTRVKALSGGQRKRVSVGYELVGEPQALILDEPTSGLDPGLERELMSSLRELSNKGTTTIVVTHSVQSVELCDQVLVLAPGGRLAFLGPAAKVAAYFGCPDIASVFSLLGSRPKTEWTAHFAQTSSFQRFVAHRPSAPPSQPLASTSRSFFGDLRVLTGRYMRSLAGDKRRLALLGLQAPLMALLFSLILQREAFSLAEAPTSATREYLLATILMMTWIGGSNSVREVVDERAVFSREKAVGVSTKAFVLSKWIVLSLITFLQALVLHLVASLRQFDRLGSGALFASGQAEFIFALAGIGISCVGLGLLISALVRDSAKALGALPLVAVTVLLLSGLVVPTAGRPGVEQITYLNPVQWGGSAAAVTVDLQTADGCSIAAPQATEADQDPSGTVSGSTEINEAPSSCTNSRWDRARSTQLINFTMLTFWSLFFMVAAAFAAQWALSRPLRR